MNRTASLKEYYFNMAVLLLLISLSAVFMMRSADFLSLEYLLLVNFIAMPVAVGMVGFVFLDAGGWIKLVILAAIPVSHLVIFGGDPGKPGIEVVLACVEMFFLYLGCLISSILNIYSQKKA